MGKPVNFQDSNGVPSSSNCVIWDGPDIKSVGLCRGQPITKAMYEMATRILALENMLLVSNFDLSCLPQTEEIETFQDLIQALITKVCT